MSNSITPLSNVDAAWLKMEDPTNLMMVTGVLMFPRPVDAGYLRALLESRLLQFERFRQRVVRPALPFAPYYWEDDPNFNIDAHLHRIGLPRPYDQPAMQQLGELRDPMQRLAALEAPMSQLAALAPLLSRPGLLLLAGAFALLVWGAITFLAVRFAIISAARATTAGSR